MSRIKLRQLKAVWLALWALPTVGLGQMSFTSDQEIFDQGLWIHGIAELKNDYDTRPVQGGTSGDFDSDGHEDIMVAMAIGLEVCWNSATGLEGLKRLSPRTESEWGRIAWDSTHRILWAERHYPHAVEAYTLEGRELALAASFDCNAASFRLMPGVGLTALNRSTGELHLLEHSGKWTVLETPGIEPMDGMLIAPLEDGGPLVLQEAGSGTMGLAYFGDGRWSDLEWWSETKRCRQWDAQSLGGDRTMVLGSTSESMWGHVVGEMNEKDLTWELPIVLHEIDYWMHVSPESNEVETFLWNTVGSGCVIRVLDAETGFIKSTDVVDEVDGLQLVLRPDLDGDGRQDYIHPLPNLSQWKYYIPWGQQTRRIFASTQAMTPAEASALPLTTHWQVGVSELEDVREIWTRQGELYVKHGSQWSVFIPQVNDAILHHPLPNDEAKEKGFLLHVPYLEIERNDRGTAPLAAVEVDRWYHFVYQRDSKLNTEVWLDGNCLFKGKSKDLGYAHNRIIFGAGFGRNYTVFGGISLDEFALFGKFLDRETIQSIARLECEEEPLYLQDFWNFENSSFASGFSKIPAQQISDPKRTRGVIGNAVTFDGIDDALRVFASISKEEMSVSCFFRVDPAGLQLDLDGHAKHTLFTLYGLYNAGMCVYYEPLECLLDMPEGAPLQSPIRYRLEDAGFPPETQLVHMSGTDFLVDGTGGLYAPSDTGWAAIPPHGRLPDTVDGVPWVEGACLYVADGHANIYDWSESGGWINAGWLAHRDFIPVLSSKNGVFFQSESAWKWLDQMQKRSYEPVDPSGLVRSVTWAVDGERIALGPDQHLTWNASNRNNSLKKDTRFYQETSRLALDVLYWIGRLALVAAAVYLIFRKRIRGWRERREQRTSAALFWSTVPPEIEQTLSILMHKPDGAFDTSELDEVLSPMPTDSDETRRARRSRFLRECNQWSESVLGVSIIERKRDQADRRRNMYTIHPEIYGFVAPNLNSKAAIKAELRPE